MRYMLIDCDDPFKSSPLSNNRTGLVLVTYCMQYPHTVPFLRNKIPENLQKHTPFRGCSVLNKCPKFGKMRGKNPNVCLFTVLLNFLALFWLYHNHALIF